MTTDKDTIRKGVFELLREDERCRNDDLWLIFRFVREKTSINLYIPFEAFSRMPNFESIRRMRAHIQNTEKKLLPTDPQVRKGRKLNEEQWREWLARAKNFGVER